MPLTGVPSAGTRHTVWLNGVEYPIVGDVDTVTRETTEEKVYRLSQWSGGVGARRADPAGHPRPNMVWDATADTSKPGGITPPLLIQTATQAGTPTQTGRIFAFAEIAGVLNAFSFGSSGGNAELIRWEWDGATETWTRTDMGVSVTGVVGKNTAIINGNLVVPYQRSTGGDPCYAYSTNGTGWTEIADGVVATSMNDPWVSNIGTSATGYALLDGTGGKAVYSFTIGAGFTLVLDSVVPSVETIKAFFSWKNDAGADVLYILSNAHMRQSNATPNAFTIWASFPGGDANYALPLGAYLYVTYGTKGAVRQYQYDANNGLVATEGGLDLADGLPTDAQGPVTDLKEAGGYIYACVSGDSAGKYTSIYKRRWPFTPEEGWHRVYKAASANESAAVLAISGADDNTLRVHVAQEASGTTDNLYFVMEGGTQEYENGGYVTFPEIVFSNTRGASAVTEATIYADDLTATETITLAFAKDGSSTFTDFGAFTSTALTLPASPDGGVTMNRGMPRITFARDTTTTLKATYRDLAFKVLVKTGLLLQHTFTVDLYRALATTTNTTIDGSRTALQALVKTGGQHTFQRDTDLDSTARRVYVQSVQSPIESFARGSGSKVHRTDKARYARVVVTEAIGS